MKTGALILALAGLSGAQDTRTVPVNTEEFQALYVAVTTELRRYEPRLTAAEREWLEDLIQDFTARFENWPRDPSLRTYLEKLDQIAVSSKHGPALRMIGQLYLHTCLDLPRGIAASLERSRIPASRAADVFRIPNPDFQRIFAGAMDAQQQSVETRLYRLFHSRARTDSLFRLLSDRIIVWRLAAWINGQGLGDPARRFTRDETLRRSFDDITGAVLRSSRDPVEWIERLAPPWTTVEPAPTGPSAAAAQHIPQMTVTAGSAGSAPFRELYAESTNFMHGYKARLSPEEGEWLESLIQGFMTRFEAWPRDPSLRTYLDGLDKIAARGKQGPILRLIGQVYLHICLDLPRGIADSLERYPIPPSRAGDIFRLPNPDYQKLFEKSLETQHQGLGTRIYKFTHSRSRTESLLRLFADRVIVWRMTAWINGQALAGAGRYTREDTLRRSFDTIAEPVMRSSRDPAEWLALLSAPWTTVEPFGNP